MLTAIPVRWLEDNGWLVGINLTASGKVLPAACRQIVLSRIAPLCGQDAGSTLTTSGSAAAFAGENTSRWTFNAQGLPQQNAEGVALPDSLSSLLSFAAKSIMADRRDALSYGALDELRNSAILLIAATSKI